MHLLVWVSLYLNLTLTSPYVEGVRRRHLRNLWTQISARTGGRLGEETHPYPILSLFRSPRRPLSLVMSQLQIRPQASVAFHPLCFFILIPFLLPAHLSTSSPRLSSSLESPSRALSSSSFSGTKSSRKHLRLENPFWLVQFSNLPLREATSIKRNSYDNPAKVLKTYFQVISSSELR